MYKVGDFVFLLPPHPRELLWIAKIMAVYEDDEEKVRDGKACR